MEPKTTILELLERGVITQFLLVSTLAGTICGLILNSREVPEILSLSFTAILGYYFRAQTSNDVNKSVERVMRNGQ